MSAVNEPDKGQARVRLLIASLSSLIAPLFQTTSNIQSWYVSVIDHGASGILDAVERVSFFCFEKGPARCAPL